MLAFAPTSGYRASPGANALVRVAAARNRLALGLCRSRSGLRSVTWYEERAIRGTRQDYSYRRWRFPYPPMPAWVDTGTAIVDKNNLAAFRESLAPHTKSPI